MGSTTKGEDTSRPVHEVSLNHRFYIAKYEIPQNLWQAVVGENRSKWKGPRNSAEMLSFDEAVQFCRQATLLMRAEKLISEDQPELLCNMERNLPNFAQYEGHVDDGIKAAAPRAA